MSGGVASRLGKMDEVPELAAAEAKAPALKLLAIGGPRDFDASALTFAEFSRSLLRRAISPSPRRMSTRLFFLSRVRPSFRFPSLFSSLFAGLSVFDKVSVFGKRASL